MLNADDLTRIAEVVRQELARALHPSVQRPAPAPLPAANDLQPEPPPPDAA